ncbi:MAG: hypothetical protein GY775_19665 [Candidatus Scalindua sp.]|nr:hypothetical protein [Candidatus Scalindua sp.]
MPTINITASLQGISGHIDNNAFSWLNDARNQPNGNLTQTYVSSSTQCCVIRASLTSGRGALQASCFRTFVFFDTTSVPGNITSADLKVYGFSQNSGDVIPIEATAWGVNGSSTTLTNSDFSFVDFNMPYSTGSTGWQTGTSQPNIFALNTDAINQMNNNQYLNVALINEQYDYNGQNMFPGTVQFNGVRFKNASYPIELEITYSSGYPNDIIDVPSGSIEIVAGEFSSQIDSVIGVQ